MRTADLPVPDVPTTSMPHGIGTHLTALGAFAVSLAGYIPYLFAALPAIYYVILIWESKTVQDWNARRKQRKLARQSAKLKAQALVVDAKIEAAALVKVAQVQAAAKVENAAVDAEKLVKQTAAGLTGPQV